MSQRSYILDTNGILRTARGPSGPQWGVWVEPGRGHTDGGAEVRWSIPRVPITAEAQPAAARSGQAARVRAGRAEPAAVPGVVRSRR